MSDRGDEQTEVQGHGVDGVNEAEAHGQAGGDEKGHGLPLRHTEEGERERDAGIGTGGCSDKGKTTTRLTHLCFSQGEEGGTGVGYVLELLVEGGGGIAMVSASIMMTPVRCVEES